jgi:mRNA-degrading endonuclease HigB of HigAB toxin-antitoxin module
MVYADHPIIARKAFDAAVEQYPKARIRLRNRALVMEEHKPRPS